MNPRDIVARSWAITCKESTLRYWGFTSSLLETLLALKLLSYQAYFYWGYFQGQTIGFFAVEELLFDYLPFGLAIGIIISILVLFVLEVFVPSICLGSIIGLAAKSSMGVDVKGGLVLGLYNFFPLFLLKELFVFGGISALITATTLIVRFTDDWAFRGYFTAIALFVFVFSIVFHFLCSFAEEAVVIDKMNVFAAMGRSVKLIVSHLGKIVFLLLLLLVISLRIVFNALVVLLIPGIIIGSTTLFLSILPISWSIVLSSILGLTLIAIASHFFAYLHVFKQTVWTLTYLALKAEKDLDIIET